MTPFRPLRLALADSSIRNFIVSNFLSQCGTWIQRVVVGWLVFHYTGSAAWVGIVAACEVVPMILVSPLGGALFDRSDRAKVMAIGQVCAQLQAVVLLALAATGLLNIQVMVACSLALGIIEGVCQPARLAIVSDMAPPALIRPAISLNAFVNNIARFIGPMVAGVALAGGGPAVGFAFNTLSFLPMIILMLSRRGRHLPGEAIGAVTFWSGIPAGFGYALKHVVLGPILMMAAVMSIFVRSLVDLMPAVAGYWYQSSVGSLAILTASVGIGASVGAIWMLSRDDLHGIATSVLTLPALSVVGLLVFALAGHIEPVACALLFIIGFCQIASGVGMQSVIHLTVDPLFRGRVLALYGVIQRALSAIGAIAIGFAVDLIDLRTTLVVASVIAAVSWLALRRTHHVVFAHIARTYTPTTPTDSKGG